jgi:predicted phosphodiesterase
MKFLVLSDLHLEYKPFEVLPRSDVDAVILAGDIAGGVDGIQWAKKTFWELPIFYVAGNHEFYDREVNAVAESLRSESNETNLFYLEKKSIYLDGIRILGTTLWTDFDFHALGDSHQRMWAKVEASRDVPDFKGKINCFADGYYLSLTPEITQRWHQQAVTWLREELAKPFNGKTVVITHHAPSALSVPLEFAKHPSTPAYASHLDSLFESVDFWIHGHMHAACRYSVGRCQVICNPRGYDSESVNFNPEFVLEISA